MKKIKLILILAIVTFSCNEENYELDTSADLSSVKSFQDYLTFTDTDTDNKITLQRLGALNNSISISTVSTRSKIGAIEFSIDGNSFTGENIHYGEETITWNSDVDDLSMYYGKEVSFSFENRTLQAESNNSSNNDAINFYIPEVLTADLYNLKDGQIQPGSYISWNADASNLNGIILAVEYRPTSQISEDMVNDYNERLIKGLTVSDSGTYTITDADLAEFPDKANLTFYVGRAGYVMQTGVEGENDVYIGAYTAMRADMFIDKNIN